jgi:hypothetical protein
MIADATKHDSGPYDFAEPVAVDKMADSDPLFAAVVETSAFQRLKSIRFLGGIDYLLVRAPNGAKGNIRYTRYQHSLGVARLALLYSDQKGLSLVERRVAYLAALLHDIGHAPLSHSLEPVFARVFGLDHHRATEALLRGEVPLGRDLFNVLKTHHVDIDRVIGVISGKELGHDGFFTGPINFDTIEGILRTRKYAVNRIDALTPEIVTQASIRRETDADLAVVDTFWECKDTVYRHVVNSRMGVLADWACRHFMLLNINQFNASHYYTTETHIFRMLPGLRQLLTSRNFYVDVERYIDAPIPYKSRHFFIEPMADFFGREDRVRYQQRREECVVTRYVRWDGPRLAPSEPNPVERDLFDDDEDTGNRCGKAVQQ